MSAIPNITLSDGNAIPAIGFGTGTIWGSRLHPDKPRQEIINGIKAAVDAGFTHFDTAEAYDTEPELGEVLQHLDRSKFFITTKISRHSNDPRAALEQSLKKLKTDYVDLYLIHSPKLEGTAIEDVWKVLEELKKAGKAKSIGVSNFSVQDLQRILAIATEKPVVNQVEFSAYLQNQSSGIYKFAKEHGIRLEAYGPLGPIIGDQKKGNLDPILQHLSQKYSKTKAQILLRWVYQVGVIGITTSSKLDRVREAAEALTFELEPKDENEITEIGSQFTLRNFDFLGHTNENEKLVK